jgi:hypothetical protein
LFDVTRSVTIMTPAASVCFVGSEFDDFLYAPIGVERNEMLLSVLSAFARLNVDPWREAAELSELPKQTATHRLTSLIARLPSGRWAHADCGVIADRLIELLPHRRPSKAPLARQVRGLPAMGHSTIVKILLCIALAATALIFAASREPSSRSDNVDVPAFGAAPPPQGPRQSQ